MQNICCNGTIYEYKYGSVGDLNDFAHIDYKTNGKKPSGHGSRSARERPRQYCLKSNSTTVSTLVLLKELTAGKWYPRSMIEFDGTQLGENGK